jgi:hypothetical protein
MKKVLLMICILPIIVFGQWNQTCGGGGITNDIGFDGQITSDGGYIITGWSLPHSMLLKVDINGFQEWFQTYSANSSGRSVLQAEDGFVEKKYIVK